jgi:hypothetical protein
MKDIAFLIPILLECPERERNLLDQLRYLLSLDASIYLYESGLIQKVPDVIGDLINKIQYRFITSDIFHRTRLLNQMVLGATNFPVIVLHDIDVFITKQQFNDARDKILSCCLDFCYPYTIWRWVAKYSEHPMEWGGEELLTSLGGSILCRRSAFIDAGMENENCISWGCEDIERFSRWSTLGYKIGRIDGALYHAEHPRNKDSGIENPYYEHNRLESEKVKTMNRQELEEYIKTWPWLQVNC